MEKINDEIINNINVFGIFVFPYMFPDFAAAQEHIAEFFAQMTLSHKLNFYNFRAYVFFTERADGIYECYMRKNHTQEFNLEKKILGYLLDEGFNIMDVADFFSHFKILFVEKDRVLRYVESPKIRFRLEICA